MTPPSPETLQVLFDHLPDTAFFIKDAEGRYRMVNESLVERCGLTHRDEVIGRHVRDLFPANLAGAYAMQDERVLRTGRPILDRLELHWHARKQAGWCLTTKLPLIQTKGRITGLIGISRDIRSPSERDQIPGGLALALQHLESHYQEELSPASLAQLAGLSSVRFARLIRRIHRMTPVQLITKTRLAAASQLLRKTNRPVVDIAHACGFYDHSAFTRAFRSATGVTPTEYRRSSDPA